MLRVHRLDPGLPLPTYAHPGDAGADLRSRVDVTLAPGQRMLVPTGLAIALPEGYAASPTRGPDSRPGTGSPSSTRRAPSTPGTAEILVNLVNLDPHEPFEVHRGDRIAQLVVQRVAEVTFEEVDSLPSSSRGDTGHGASGGFGPRET